MTISFSITPAGLVDAKRAGPAIGFCGQPAGVVVLANLDVISSRAHLLALVAELKAAILADADPLQLGGQ